MEQHQAPGKPPGAELEPRREMLPAELVAPNRAGAIVAEFVNSIVEEAQARALDMIRAAANQDDAGQHEALEKADRMRARIDQMAEELEDAVGQLRKESDRLAGLREQTTFAALAGAAPVDTGEQQALAQVAAGLERGDAPADTEEPAAEETTDEAHDVEVVAQPDDEEPETEVEDAAVAEAPVEGHAEEEPEEPTAEWPAVTEEPVAEEPAVAEEPQVAEDPTVAEEQPTAAEEPTVAEEQPTAAEEPTVAEEQPTAAEEPTVAEEQPTAAEEPTVAEEQPTAAEEPTVAEEPSLAEQPTVADQSAVGDEEVPPGPEELLAERAAELEEREVAAPAQEASPLDQASPVGDISLAGLPDEEPEAAGTEEAPVPTEEEELAADQERFARMDDAQLAQAYSDALEQMDLEASGSERGARLLRYAGSALGEALTRPTFADIGQGAPPLEPVPRMGRKRRRRAEAINTLRRACAQAIEEMSAEEPVSSS